MLHWSLLRCATIIVGTAVVNIAQFVRGGDACFFRWARCAVGDALMLHIIGRRHGLVERKPGSQTESY